MFGPTSRYRGLPVAELVTTSPTGDRETIRYVTRRVRQTPTDETIVLGAHRVSAGDRIDNVAAQYLGDPTQFWRICDTNGVTTPESLVSEPDEVIRIAVPGR